MTDEMRLDGMGIAPGVLETIATQAACKIEGVEAVGPGGIAGLVGLSDGIEIELADDGGLEVAVHVSLAHGRPLHEVGSAVQSAVSEALESMTDQTVRAVDVYVDHVAFADK